MTTSNNENHAVTFIVFRLVLMLSTLVYIIIPIERNAKEYNLKGYY